MNNKLLTFLCITPALFLLFYFYSTLEHIKILTDFLIITEPTVIDIFLVIFGIYFLLGIDSK